MNKHFCETMSTSLLQAVFLREVVGKSKEEIEILKKLYEASANIAFEREMAQAGEGWMS